LQDPSLKSLLTSQQSNKREEEAGDGNIDIEKSVLPSLVSFLQKLDSELLKAFQNISHTKFEYLLRIRDENKFLYLCDQVQSFITAHFPNEHSKSARIAILQLDHLYYKSDSLYSKFTKDETTYIPTLDSKVLIEGLVRQINLSGTSKMKVRAAL